MLFRSSRPIVHRKGEFFSCRHTEDLPVEFGCRAGCILKLGLGNESGIILPGFPLFKIVGTVVGRVNPGKAEFLGFETASFIGLAHASADAQQLYKCSQRLMDRIADEDSRAIQDECDHDDLKERGADPKGNLPSRGIRIKQDYLKRRDIDGVSEIESEQR